MSTETDPVAGAEQAHDIVIRFEGVTKAFGTAVVLRDICLDIRRGSATVICGPSGSGKSTLLRCINGLSATFRQAPQCACRIIDATLVASSAFRAEIGRFSSVSLIRT